MSWIIRFVRRYGPNCTGKCPSCKSGCNGLQGHAGTHWCDRGHRW